LAKNPDFTQNARSKGFERKRLFSTVMRFH
jgi:hypothetical protein